jgi:hypothetical protein
METLQTARAVGDDGEILAGIFCDACGDLNETGASSCGNCGAYLLDQGPDLSARLSRIRRYAGATKNVSREEPYLTERTLLLLGLTIFLFITIGLTVLLFHLKTILHF